MVIVMSIEPRRMRINFKDMPLRWSAIGEFATILNASSPIASSFEPYLNRVMARIRDRLPEQQNHLKRDLNLFIEQEAHHYRVHNTFNKELYARYPKLREIEDQIAADLDKMFKEKSLEYNASYCCGFENLACYNARWHYERASDLYEGADARGASLFQWHIAEEYEHRSACHDAFKAISSNYFTRMRGFFYSMFHLLGYNQRAVKYCLEVDRATMTDEERARSIKAAKAIQLRMAGFLFTRMLWIFLPFYDPAKQKAHPSLLQALDKFGKIAMDRQAIGA